MPAYINTLNEFFSLALLALQMEDLLLRSLLLNRIGYQAYHPGIFSSFETSLVYCIFKSLLSSPFAENNNVHWEMPGGNRTSMDLYVQKRGQGNHPRIGIEVKWWNPTGILGDIHKLQQNQSAGHINHGAILVLKMVSGQRSLQDLVSQSISPQGNWPAHVQVLSLDKFSSYSAGNTQTTIEVALLLVC